MAIQYDLIEKVNGLGYHGENWCLSRALLAHVSTYASHPDLNPQGCNGECPPGRLLERVTTRIPFLNNAFFVQEWMQSVYAWNFGLRQDKMSTSVDIGNAWSDHLFGAAFSYICGTEYASRKGKPFDFLNPKLDLRKLYDAVESLAISRQIALLEAQNRKVWPVLRTIGISPKAVFRLPLRILQEAS